jgi:hypothetical protein
MGRHRAEYHRMPAALGRCCLSMFHHGIYGSFPASDLQGGPHASEPHRGAPSGSREIRNRAADIDFNRPHPTDVNNGDETELPNFPSPSPLFSTPPQQDPNFIGNYSKGLPHNAFGEVNRGAYSTLLQALSSGDPADFERIYLGSPANPAQFEPRRLVNPQSGLAFDLQGPDAQQDTLPPAPKFSSAEQAAEAAELYWMAILRDVAFTSYNTDPNVATAATSLSNTGTG